MTIEPWVGFSGIVLTLLAALIRHMVNDASYRQRLKNLEHRVKKLDGIDANGD